MSCCIIDLGQSHYLTFFYRIVWSDHHGNMRIHPRLLTRFCCENSARSSCEGESCQRSPHKDSIQNAIILICSDRPDLNTSFFGDISNHDVQSGPAARKLAVWSKETEITCIIALRMSVLSKDSNRGQDITRKRSS